VQDLKDLISKSNVPEKLNEKRLFGENIIRKEWIKDISQIAEKKKVEFEPIDLSLVIFPFVLPPQVFLLIPL
jgi:hypothetical protein